MTASGTGEGLGDTPFRGPVRKRRVTAQNSGSLQDLIRSRQQGAFVGRTGQLVQFQENLGLAVDDDRRWFLFNIYGDAGVGKTYLTRQLGQLASAKGALTAFLDETADDAVGAMRVVAGQLAQTGARLEDFEKRVSEYQRRRQDLESDPKAPDDIAAFLTKTAVTIGLAAARDIPVAGSLLAPIDPASAADQANRARAYLARRLGSHADVQLVLSPVAELTPVFVTDLRRVAGSRLVALFIDTYERTGLVLDAWLRRLYQGQYGDLPATLVTTITGQKPLNPNLWSDYLPVIADVPLAPFSDAEARQFLASKDIHGEDVIQAIMSVSGGLPLRLATLAEARPGSASDIGDPASDAVERFLKWEDDPARRRVAVAASLPRFLNRDVLAVVAAVDEVHELFGWLCGLPFIEHRAGAWAYHEVVRGAMLRVQQAQSPSEWASHQTALAQAHERWARDAGRAEEDWASELWVDHTREQAYHLLCANPGANLSHVLTLAVKGAAHSAVLARQWAELIADAGTDTRHPLLRQWGQHLSDGIQDDDLTGYFTVLINYDNLGDNALGIALVQRGEEHRLAGRHVDAVADFTRTLELDPENAWATASRGQAYQAIGHYGDALADLDRAIELDPGLLWAIVDRGLTYQAMERYDEAIADFTRAIELAPSYAWAIVNRGETFGYMKRYDDAVADFTRAIELDPEQSSVCSRGVTYRKMERYDDALADFTHALELGPEYGPTVHRGLTYQFMRHYDEALADLNRAVDLYPESALALAGRGETYRRMGHYDEALADLNHAIELYPDGGWPMVSRGLTYQSMERHDDALADLSYVIDDDPESAEALVGRGEIYLRLGRHDDALADFSRAIEIDPEQSWVVSRGRACRHMALVRRGQVYRYMKRYEDALADFGRAIELDPDSEDSKSEYAAIQLIIGNNDETPHQPPETHDCPPNS
jgi:tetratricopeptide (TPR) repeat protein